jgi:hypothetical protein
MDARFGASILARNATRQPLSVGVPSMAIAGISMLHPTTSTALASANPWLADAMEVVDSEHFDGVVQVLHRAKSGMLRTQSGSFVVRPVRDANADDYLFGLDFVTRCDAPESLVIDALELNFGDTVFALDGSAVALDEGALRVIRPTRLFSAGTQIVDLPTGRATLKLAYEGEFHRTRIWGFSVDQLLVEGFDDDDMDLSIHVATIEYQESDFTSVVPCTVAFQGFSPMGYIRLTVYTDAQERPELVRIHRLIRFPHLRDRGELDSDRVIELFRASNYLDLRETENTEPTDAWCCPDFAGDLSIDTIYRAGDGALLGHVSVTRAYSRTWLGHQLATLKGHPESFDCRISLYNHFASTPGSIDGEDVYLLGYYDRSKRWHQLFFESFVDWLADPREVAVVPFDRYEPIELGMLGMHGMHVVPELEHGVDIHRARAEELDELAALVRRQMPPLARVAFDLDADKLDAAYLHPEYEAQAVPRGREAFAIREQGELVGVALVEHGSPHLSLFNLLNLAQLYFTDAASRSAKAQAFRFVRGHYAERGTMDPILVTTPGTNEHPGDAGMRLAETMGCIIWSGRSLAQYQSYVRYCFEKIDETALTIAKARAPAY